MQSDWTPRATIWHEHADPREARRNEVVMFRGTFDRPSDGTLRIFANTRYRLFVNGTLVGHGPARFFWKSPRHDAHDVAGLLRDGRNVVAVAVSRYDCPNFHAEPGPGGLACEVGDAAVDWKATWCEAYAADAPKLSFALQPAEVVDLRELPAGWEQPDFDDSAWSAAGEVDLREFERLRPRPIGPLDESPRRPERAATFDAAAPAGETLYSVMVHDEAYREHVAPGRVSAECVIASPREQAVPLTIWWGRYTLNGEEIAPSAKDADRRRQTFEVTLRAGENRLEASERARDTAWEFRVGVPDDAGLTLGPPSGAMGDGPMRQLAWQRPSHHPAHERAALRFGEGNDRRAFLYDFGGEFLGRPRLEFTARAGTTVDVSVSERLKDDGTAEVHSRFLVDMVQRCVAREGRQTWHLLHPVGGRYLEVLTSDPEHFELHDMTVTQAVYDAPQTGEFECDDPRLNAIWRLCPPTVRHCMEDGFLDCPWRERGVYSGDVLVEMHAALATCGDTSVARRSIEIFFEAQGESGLIPGGAHGLPPGRHPDYSAILVIALAEYLDLTGDTAFLDESAGPVRRLLDGLLAMPRHDSGVIDGGEGTFIDVAQTTRKGPTCAFNAFVYAALVRGGDMLDDAHYRDEADRLKSAMLAAFWDDAAGAFRDLPNDPASPATVHGNATAILYDIADDAQARRAGDVVADLLRRNFDTGGDKAGERGQYPVASYFAYYAIEALSKLGRDREARDFIDDAWGRMVDAGAWTTWEYFWDGNTASRCHAWSCAPAVFLSTRVLGVTRPTPDSVRVDPKPCGLTWARGAVPHRRGPVRVAWRLGDDDKTVVEVDAPEGVEVL